MDASPATIKAIWQGAWARRLGKAPPQGRSGSVLRQGEAAMPSERARDRPDRARGVAARPPSGSPTAGIASTPREQLHPDRNRSLVLTKLTLELTIGEAINGAAVLSVFTASLRSLLIAVP